MNAVTPVRGANGELAAFAVRATVPAEARLEAAIAIVDTLAVMIAGGVAPPVRALERVLTPLGSGAPSFWTEARFPPQDAALLYGMAAHMHDYDDVSMLAVCHPSAPILSALIAAKPWRELETAPLLDAFVIGVEVLVRLGEAMGFRHYELGFHATSTLGTVGAAAAVARLLGLDTATTAHALAIAASYSSGLRKNFGSHVKPLHVGMAASNGLRCATLAAAGLQGAAEAFEGEGFLKAFSGGAVDSWPAHARLGAPFAIVKPGLERKRYPCCYMLHKMVEATIALANEHALDLEQLRSAEVLMPPGGTKPLIHPRPRNGLEARFSAPYAILAAIADRRMDLGVLSDAAVMRPEIQSRLDCVKTVEEAGASVKGSEVDRAPVTVILDLNDGRRLTRTVVASPGSAEDPMTSAQLRAKWLDCLNQAAPGVGADEGGALFELGIAGADIGEWLQSVRRALTESHGARAA